ncbi:hypothetical protein [Brevibacillus centrosporus]|uniref:hypothetical protein n=1 Tax=Brevibacillus centrosporus TaxID=54910 RepID=UPI000F09A564|nr:hypothetical protein [Brevibacillus centrosporus]MEC2129810.1 hypothetical protein [Brevibacillus centrosporus]MED4907107.1 hypothetical protein [Brevibacillus centrosporus]
MNTQSCIKAPCSGTKPCQKQPKQKPKKKPQSCPQQCTQQTTALLNQQKAKLNKNLKRLKKRIKRRIKDREKQLRKRLKKRLKKRERKLRKEINRRIAKLLRNQENASCAYALYEMFGNRTVQIQTVTGNTIIGTIKAPLSPELVQVSTATGIVAVPCSSISSISIIS